MKFLHAFIFLLSSCALLGDIVRDLPYVPGGGPRQRLDIHRPERAHEQALPVMVMVHGGGWKAGDKADPVFIKPLVSWCHAHGYLAVAVNYRLSPAVRHPAHVEDVRAAVSWVQRHIRTYGGDPGQIFLCGHSAGAHLAALVGVERSALARAGGDPAGIRGVLLFDGVAYDLPVQMRLRTPFPKTEGIFAATFGTDIDAARAASPAYRIDGPPPPFLLLHARMERSSRLQAQIFAHALRKAGGKAVVKSIWGKNHGNLASTLLSPGDPTAREISRFLGADP
jgi:acetyl esterase/lipase